MVLFDFGKLYIRPLGISDGYGWSPLWVIAQERAFERVHDHYLSLIHSHCQQILLHPILANASVSARAVEPKSRCSTVARRCSRRMRPGALCPRLLSLSVIVLLIDMRREKHPPLIQLFLEHFPWTEIRAHGFVIHPPRAVIKIVRRLQRIVPTRQHRRSAQRRRLSRVRFRRRLQRGKIARDVRVRPYETKRHFLSQPRFIAEERPHEIDENARVEAELEEGEAIVDDSLRLGRVERQLSRQAERKAHESALFARVAHLHRPTNGVHPGRRRAQFNSIRTRALFTNPTCAT